MELLFLLAAPASASVLIDFGIHTNLTASPDGNGHFWNNIHTDSTLPPPAGPHTLTNTAGALTSIQVSLSGFGNGANTNGTTVPDGALGPLAASDAVRDSFYVGEGTPATIAFAGLAPNAIYRLDCFGSRDTTNTRVTRYTASGATTATATLVTSGSGIGIAPQPDAQRSSFATLHHLRPTSTGTLQLTVGVESGTYAYIGALYLQQTGSVASASNQAPTASGVAFFGAPRVGTLFTGLYTYADAENDSEGATRFQWQRAATTNDSPADIAGATALTFAATSAELGHYLRLAVTPLALSGTLTGSTAYSEWRGPLAPSNALAVFHIGNSFTRWGNVPAQLAGFAAASNRPHAYGEQLADGQGVGYHWTNGLPGGALTRGSPSRAELATASWDALVLQPMSREWQSTNLAAFQANAELFDALADSAGVQLYLYVYWPWRDDPLSDQDGINAAFEQVRAALSSNGLPVRVIPVGEAFRAAVNEMGAGELAGLTRDDLYQDELHPSDIGYYLSSLVHFAVLHRRSPVGLPAIGIDSDVNADGPVSIPTNIAAAFQRIAWDVARFTPHTGVTAGRYEEWFDASGLPGSGAPDEAPHPDGLPNLVRWAHGISSTPYADPDRLPTIARGASGGIEIRYAIGADAQDAGLVFYHEWTTNYIEWGANSPTGMTTTTAGDERTLSFPGDETPLGFRYRIELPP